MHQMHRNSLTPNLESISANYLCVHTGCLSAATKRPRRPRGKSLFTAGTRGFRGHYNINKSSVGARLLISLSNCYKLVM